MKKASKSYKVIIDTNLWISFLIGKHLSGLQKYLDNQSIRIISCNEQLIELSEVFKKPKLKKYFSKEQVIEFFELLEDCSEIITLVTKSEICRDAKDNYLVSLAIDSCADYLITGDLDLLELNLVRKTRIIKFSELHLIIK